MKTPRPAPCPGSPNCVSSLGTGPGDRMDPIPFESSRAEAKSRLSRVIQGMSKSLIEVELDDYIHATFRSLIFGFVDDVEFWLDDSAKAIHFRSASRTGYYDFGVNRRRMEAIRAAFIGSE